MKKLLFTITVLLISAAFAELYPSRRYVEVGTTVQAQASENIMPIADFLKKDLVLDISSIYSKMGDNGFVLTGSIKPEFYTDLNFKKFGFGIHFGADFSGSLSLSKELFGFLAEGFEAGESKSADVDFWMQSFATFSVPVRFNIGSWRIKVTTTYFMPAFYIPNTNVSGSVTNSLDGKFEIVAAAPIVMYTAGKIKDFVVDGKISTDFVDSLDGADFVREMARNGGLDLSALVEYPVTDELDVGGYARIPVIPGRLKNKVETTVTATVRMPSMMGVLLGDEETEKNYETSDAVYSDANYSVNRPLRLGGEAAWRPFGAWFTVRGSLGFGLRNPFGKDVNKHSWYPEYLVGLEVAAFNVFGLNLYSEYTEKVFANTLGVMLNFRAVEIDLTAAMCSSNFTKSWMGHGFRAGVGLKFGW